MGRPWRFTGADEGVALVLGPDDSWAGVVTYRPGRGWDAWSGIEIGNYPSRREAAEAIAAWNASSALGENLADGHVGQAGGSGDGAQ